MVILIYLEVNAVKEKSLDCFQCLVATVASHYQRDYELMFASSWIFDVLEKSDVNTTFGRRLEVGWRIVNFKMLKKYHGINIVCNKTKNVKEVVNLIQKNLSSGIPIIVNVSSYNCPWSQSYKKYKVEHYCLVIGYNEANDIFYCLDPMMADGLVELPYSDLEDGFGQCFTVELERESSLDNQWKDILLSGVRDIEVPGGFTARSERIRIFAYQMSEKLDIKLEKKGFNDDFAVPLFRKLKEIGDSRINYARMMSYIARNYNCACLIDLAQEMMVIGEMWYKYRLNFLKATYVLTHFDKNSRYMVEIANIEEELAQKVICNIDI